MAARQQPEPQSLLFVFLKASLPEDHQHDQADRYHSGQGGELQAIMCVDKAPDELGDFSELVIESEQMGQDWQIVLVAGLSGSGGQAPNNSEIEQSLKKMVEAVRNGSDLSRYMAFDRTGEPVHFEE